MDGREELGAGEEPGARPDPPEQPRDRPEPRPGPRTSGRFAAGGPGASGRLRAFDPVRLSKQLAFVLRHRPDVVGLALDAGGWVDVETLVARLNERRRLPFSVRREDVEALVQGEGRGRFELAQGRLRARGGHTVAGVDARRRAAAPVVEEEEEHEAAPGGEGDDRQAPGVPEFLFAGVDGPGVEHAFAAGQLLGPGGRPLRLHVDEAVALDDDGADEVVVVDVARAARQGVSIDAGPDGVHAAPAMPLKFVLSLRDGFTRQVSAGGVLVKGRGAAAEFALIRTLPRDQAAEPGGEPEIEDPRGASDRRGIERRTQDLPPPGGVERRGSGTERRQRRRRRSGRWGPEGRLELPKGKLEPGETAEQAAVREVREELGIAADLAVEATLATNHYAFRTPEQRVVFKTVHYFLLTCPTGEPTFAPRREEGIVSVEWWPGPRAISQVAFKNLRPVLERAWQIVGGA